MVTKTLRPDCIGDTIAADDAIHPNVVVKIIAGHGVSNFVDVLANRESADFDHFGTSKALPVKTLRSKNAGEAVAKLVE
jgi:hypothetical protein